jgi:hypothetical protein
VGTRRGHGGGESTVYGAVAAAAAAAARRGRGRGERERERARRGRGHGGVPAGSRQRVYGSGGAAVRE